MKTIKKASLLFASLALVLGAGLVGNSDTKEVKAEGKLAKTYDLSSSLPSDLSSSESLAKDSNNPSRGMGKAGKTYTLTSSDEFANVTSIVVNAATNYEKYQNHSISVTIGGVSFGSNQSFTQKASNDYTISSDTHLSGNIVVSLNNSKSGTTKSNTIWVKTITVYTEVSGTITSVSLDGDMTKKSYYTGDKWDLTGLYLSVTWNTNDITKVNLSELTVNSDYLLDTEAPALNVTSLYITGTYENFDFEKTIKDIVVLEKPTIKHAGTLEDPYTVADALLKAEETGTTATTEEFYVEGIVSSKYSSTNTDYDFIYKGSATFNISDDGTTNNEFAVFKIKNTGGSKFDDNYANNIIIGDTKVVAKGNIINYKGTTPEFVSNNSTAGELVSITSISAEQFIDSWKELRANNKNSICEAILNDRESLNTLLNKYKELNSFAASIVDETIDSGDATIKRTIEYVTGILDGSQPTDGKYGINSGVIITSNYSIDSTSLIALFALLGIGAISAYYFIEKKKLSK